MAHNPKPSAKNEQGEYAVFENALKKVLSVSHAEMQARLKKSEDKRNRASKRSSASSRASNGSH